MAFFDDLTRKAKDVAAVAADKAKDAAELTKITVAIAGEQREIDKNYRTIVGFNTGLIALGVAGILQPTTSALLHNTSTLVISLNSMKPLCK